MQNPVIFQCTYRATNIKNEYICSEVKGKMPE